MNGKHTTFFKAALAAPKRVRSHKVSLNKSPFAMRCHFFNCISAVILSLSCGSAMAQPASSKQLPPSIVVVGQSKAPQLLPYTPEITLISAIVSTGGLGDHVGIFLVRNTQVQEYNYNDIRKSRDKDPLLKPWDIIVLRPAYLPPTMQAQ